MSPHHRFCEYQLWAVHPILLFRGLRRYLSQLNLHEHKQMRLCRHLFLSKEHCKDTNCQICYCILFLQDTTRQKYCEWHSEGFSAGILKCWKLQWTLFSVFVGAALLFSPFELVSIGTVELLWKSYIRDTLHYSTSARTDVTYSLSLCHISMCVIWILLVSFDFWHDVDFWLLSPFVCADKPENRLHMKLPLLHLMSACYVVLC